MDYFHLIQKLICAWCFEYEIMAKLEFYFATLAIDSTTLA